MILNTLIECLLWFAAFYLITNFLIRRDKIKLRATIVGLEKERKTREKFYQDLVKLYLSTGKQLKNMENTLTEVMK